MPFRPSSWASRKACSTASTGAAPGRLMVFETPLSTWRWKAACMRTWASGATSWAVAKTLHVGRHAGDALRPAGGVDRGEGPGAAGPLQAGGEQGMRLGQLDPLERVAHVGDREERLDARRAPGDHRERAGGSDGGDGGVAPRRLSPGGGRAGAPELVYRLPGLFGKWSRPNYNAVVSTFYHNVARGLPFQVRDPAHEVELAYVDDVVVEFLGALAPGRSSPAEPKVEPTFRVTLGELARRIEAIRDIRDTLTLSFRNCGYPIRKAVCLSFSLGADARPALAGVLVLLEDQDARALGGHEAVPPLVERAAGLLRGVVALRHGARGAEAGQPQRREGGLGAVGDNHVGHAPLQVHHGVTDGVVAGGAGRDRREVRSLQAVAQRDLPRGQVDDDGRDEERAHLAHPRSMRVLWVSSMVASPPCRSRR